METQEQPAAGERRGVPTWVAEAAIAALVLAFGLVVLVGSRNLGSGWTSDGPGPGYFPFYIGLILCVSAAGILVQALAGNKRDTRIFVDREQLKRVLVVLIPAGVYVLGIQLLGLYVASAIYIAGFMVMLGKFPKAASVGLGVTTAAVFFLMFQVWFKVPLAKGALDPLGFLGY